MHALNKWRRATPDATQLANDRYEIGDALHRFAAGQDLRDGDLLASAFTLDAALDFTQPARKFGVEMPVLRGRDQITVALGKALIGLDTTHTVTNTRIVIDEDSAELFALVEAQHLPRRDHGRHLLLKNFYRVSLMRSGAVWKIWQMRIENSWHQGDPTVLFPGVQA
ncbi:hypothetical protein BWI17_11460 [Betaproteobacteria bacterium GR16-43]|nr:hypothetical protein BWI17_11460 [Betaproteobacteria bacterium GR16-43]